MRISKLANGGDLSVSRIPLAVVPFSTSNSYHLISDNTDLRDFKNILICNGTFQYNLVYELR